MSIQAEKLPRFTDISWRWIAYSSSTVVAAGIVFAFFQEVELKRDVPCEIVSPSEIKIKGLSGLVTNPQVVNGQQVHQGQPLFQLARDFTLSSDGTPRPRFDEAMRDEQIATATTQHDDRRAALAARLEATERTGNARELELQAIDRQQLRTRQMAEDSQRALGRLEGLADYVVLERVEQARLQANQSAADVAQGDARRQSLLSEIETLRGSNLELKVQQRELDTQLAREIQDIRLRFEAARQNAIIFAPHAGIVTFSSLVAGHTLEAEDVALVINTGSNQPLVAALSIPSRQRGFIREGQIVRLKLDAYPYARFGALPASIESISDTAMNKSENTPAPASSKPAETNNYMAWATLSGATFGPSRAPLRILPGMRGTASVVIERRTIAEWVLEPLFQMIRG
ncbi:HlyD family secretion protein [Pseudomonas sp. BGr12]|uniref:HlyD family secretion protein n=1 Tax=unclassified Pseudomonas TaxID=196821 RepID=UPI00177C5C77|nr:MULTISPECIES: HlyD family efflux transporter periplasmic adaptor subunit [unclassified Pseudomonas]MBD9503893.1 HlyD family efflux transporter periplasmic adaptor subunit [Pseudomonas sp. PDM17]MDL2429490.1 HlyD family secretion protein [Pseudomonas sp. BJa5]